MQTIVGMLMQQQKEEVEINWGAITMDQWLENRTQEMLDILWELEEGPDPQLDVYINWRRVDDRMAACKTLFTLGRDLHNQWENRQRSGEMGEMDGKGDRDDGLEDGLVAGEDDCGENTNISNNISYDDIKDSDGDNHNNNNIIINNNNNADDGGADVHSCSMMGVILQVDAYDNGDGNNNKTAISSKWTSFFF
ncbi:hypothetical protein CBR_g41692 [Chara braunii]|uniref:Uncharacterized protein n=1 Tax=Chara braunii TaxID=69332 RepID=A0A388LWP0_CHABU|nr:hypothetical protein CBR_g41692 [Chara braunii]|eukprot:GBG86629.1 hypothetical protein CBR_g41692 [Chara braunii]